VTLGTTLSGRASGFPRMVRLPHGGLVVAWTAVVGEDRQVRVATVEVQQ
jgi:hypothetical protein